MTGMTEDAKITAGGDNNQREGRRVTLARVTGFDPARLHRVRTSSGLSARDLADLAGVSEDTIHKWEAGTTSPDPRHARQLAHALRVSVRDLTSLTDEQVGLTELRVFRGQTLRGLAQEATISASTLSNIEVGHRQPTPDQATRIGVALDMAPQDVLQIWQRVRQRRLDQLHGRTDAD